MNNCRANPVREASEYYSEYYKCSICCKDMDDEYSLFSLRGCNHTYHMKCLLSVWELGAHSCPCCRNGNNRVNEFLAKFDELVRKKEECDEKCAELEDALEEDGIRRFGYMDTDKLTDRQRADYAYANENNIKTIRNLREQSRKILRELEAYKVLVFSNPCTTTGVMV